MSPTAALASAYLCERPVRAVLGVLTIAAASCLVVWVVSGYDALLQSNSHYAQRALGRYVLSIDPISRAPERHVQPGVDDALRQDPRVAAADPMWAVRVPLAQGAGAEHAPAAGLADRGESARRSRRSSRRRSSEILVLGTDAAAPPFDMVEGVWIGDESQPAGGVCLSSQIAEQLGLTLGQALHLTPGSGPAALTIVGIVDNPPVPISGPQAQVGSMSFPSPSIAGAYVTMAAARRMHQQEPVITFIGVALEDPATVHSFRYEWGPKLAQGESPLQFQRDIDLEESLDEAATASNIALQSYAATAVSMALAFLMVFNLLNIGVTERSRELALLRAVALTRRQVATVILLEAALLTIVGLAVGLLLAMLLLRLVHGGADDPTSQGATIGRVSLIMATVPTAAGALLAALAPAWRATRVRPLDAISPQQDGGLTSSQIPLVSTALGIGLIGVDLALSASITPDFQGPAVAMVVAGFACLIVGIVLLAPAVVVITDRYLGPLAARLARVHPVLLSKQLSCRRRRNVAAAAALTVGLGLFLAIQTWGFTMLSAFVPGPWVPDAIINFGPAGATSEQIAQVRGLDSTDPERCVPIVAEQPRLLRDLTGSAERASIIRQNNVTIVGLDPRVAFGGPAPLLPVQWAAGSAETAIERLEQGRACVVPDHFLRESGLSVGDSFALVPPEDPAHPRSYTIAGAVQLPGWHWVTKEAGLRTRTHRTAALVFAGYASVASDFGKAAPACVWLRYQPGLARDADLAQQVNAIAGVPDGRRGPRVVTIEHTRRRVLRSASGWIWGSSVLPLVVVLIACLGLLNLILASVRARYWEFGVLRSIGFSRGTIVRLIVCESVLIGSVACVLSLIFGLGAGWSGTAAASQMSFFGGMRPELVVPAMGIAVGWAALLLLTALTGTGPALAAGRHRPLALLQQAGMPA